MADIRVVRNTAAFVDSIVFGDFDTSLDILETQELNLDLPISNIERYLKCEIPKVRIDVVNSWQFVEPEHVLGCVFVKNASKVFHAIMSSGHRPESISDTDIHICTYLADIDTYNLALTHFPHLLTNHRARGSFHTRAKHLKSFNPMYKHCFTGLHAALISCFIYRTMSIHYNRTLSFFNRQACKIQILLANQATLDGLSNYSLSLAGQLLFHNDFKLFEKCVNIGLIKIHACEMYVMFIQFMRYYKIEAIKYIFRSPYCEHLDFQINHRLLGHDAIVRKGFLKKIDACQRSEITEIIVNNNFTFIGNITYDIQIQDSQNRIYNLYHAGIYIRDRNDCYPLIDKNNPLACKIALILRVCKSPFSLERLSRLKVKAILGPKHYYYKLKHLKDILPDHLLRSLALIRFTKGLKLPVKSYIPQERVGDKPYSDVFPPEKKSK